MTRVVSIGLDGAAWHKLDRLMDEGRMPNLKKLAENGVRAPLRTVHPPVTCPAWRCSTSGKNPGKLGVFWWLDLDRRTGEMSTPDALSFDTTDVWDYLSDDGKRCAVLNVPMTYPPSEVNGKMVSGFGAPFDFDADAGSITYPAEFESEIRERYDWKIGIDDITTPEGRQATYDIIRTRFELLLDLLEDDYEYLHLTVFYINMLQHKYGDGEETVKGWEIIDKYLGELLDQDAILLIYSDHGHSTIENTFVVNRWLLEQGYLELKDDAMQQATQGLYSTLSSIGISPKRLARVASNVLPERVYERLVSSMSPISTSGLDARIDWERSDAVALSQGPLYINRSRIGTEYTTFRDELRDELKGITFQGRNVLHDIHKTDDVYVGEHVNEGPDLMLVSNEGWEIYGGIVPSIFERNVSSWTSGNHPLGILLSAGPGVASDELSEQSILDIAPTILAYLDCAVPTDMDGEPMDQLFGSDVSYTSREPIKSVNRARSGTDEELSDQLQDLGYLE